ncbi:MAG TPA: SLBB domain-containing protein [Acidisarcina sp.]
MPSPSAHAQNYPLDSQSGSNGNSGMSGSQDNAGDQNLDPDQFPNGPDSDTRSLDNRNPGRDQNAPASYDGQQSRSSGGYVDNSGPTYVDNAGRTVTDNNGTGSNGRSLSSVRQPRVVAPLPPPLTEFQKLIYASVGQLLPIFGKELFQGVPSTFAPLDQVPVTADYVIGPGDELRVHVWGQVNFNANVRVNPSGSIYLPQVGEVHVAGLTFSDLDAHLRSGISRIYRNFDVSVELGQLRSIQVFVVGQARRPGSYTISSLSTLVNALFFSGGPSPEGSMRNIQVKRGATTVTTFDLYDLLVNGDKSKDVHLLPGDVIFIPPAGPQVAVAGSVRNPAIYETRGSTTLAMLLELAGGRTSVAGDSRISIERISSRHSREAMEIANDPTGLTTAVEDGDLVRLISMVPRFDKTITLRGNVANPGHFAWRPGMHLSDLIPDKESLITRDYWSRRGRLGLPAPEFIPTNRPESVPGTTISSPSGQLDPGSTRTTDRTGTNLAPGQSEAGRTSLAGTQSQVATPNTASATRLNDVSLSAPEIDWSYAVIERLNAETLTSSLLPFNLGKLVLEKDPNQDLELEAGDTVTIFSQADIHVPVSQQTKFVRLDGEFARSGIYSVLPGETLRQLVRRAGGLAPNSYLYGSEFTRVSTRAVQQQRLDEYVRSLEIQIDRTQLNVAATSTTALDTQAAAAALTPQQNLVARLRQLRASGRIVLESKPASSDVDSLPDLPLEDGDYFVIPPRPASINVVGSVNNQNSFLYSPTRRTGDYLRLAGGPNRDADPHRAFIIRADGSVLSRSASLNLWGNAFEATRMYPGDTLVVPERVYKTSALRGFLDWSQLFSQVALGAAAINILK